ncbi:hypothetical protein BV22DRAFT_1051959 [Leucogyrophana mollusca]|uniref:Uncharacterized protein n=1 Tax=Leucogyrophana mollusca TaxID=85980 RepID=A0ACB8B086_9AGAM|nr:hypothetical protein BV22DRAFT_1051959 [Leucogyrophana mollusca]
MSDTSSSVSTRTRVTERETPAMLGVGVVLRAWPCFAVNRVERHPPPCRAGNSTWFEVTRREGRGVAEECEEEVCTVRWGGSGCVGLVGSVAMLRVWRLDDGPVEGGVLSDGGFLESAERERDVCGAHVVRADAGSCVGLLEYWRYSESSGRTAFTRHDPDRSPPEQRLVPPNERQTSQLRDAGGGLCSYVRDGTVPDVREGRSVRPSGRMARALRWGSAWSDLWVDHGDMSENEQSNAH